MSWKQIADDILDEREAIIRKWLESDDGEALLRLERAFASLTGELPPSIAEIAYKLDPTKGVSVDVVDVWVGPSDAPPTPPSVKEAVEKLVLSDSARIWSIADVYNVLENDSYDYQVKSLRGSVRSALYQMENTDGTIIKDGKGKYRVVQIKDSLSVTDGLLPSGVNEGGSGEGQL